MEKKNNLVFLEPIQAIPITQGEFSFYIFKIKAKKLLSIAYTSERTQANRAGIQRGLRRDRLIAIGRYLEGKKSGDPILPNTIIVSLSEDSYYDEYGYIHIVDRASAEAFVIDGQHRLWSFSEEFSGDTDMELVVSAFISLPNDKKALIFKTINGEQRKINPSLVYDLIPMLREKEWVLFEDSRTQEIVDVLNADVRSPWANRISMVGEPGKILSQAAFITAIKKLFKNGHIFSTNELGDLYEIIIQENILIEYFISISDQYSVEWDNKDYLLCKYVGVSAILMLLELIVKDIKDQGKAIVNEKSLNISSTDFDPYIMKLKSYNFSAKEAKNEGKSYVGEGGVNELFRKIVKIVFP